MNDLIQKTIKHFKDKLVKEKGNTVVKEKDIKHKFNDVLERLAKIQIAKVCVFCGNPFTIDAVN